MAYSKIIISFIKLTFLISFFQMLKCGVLEFVCPCASVCLEPLYLNYLLQHYVLNLYLAVAIAYMASFWACLYPFLWYLLAFNFPSTRLLFSRHSVFLVVSTRQISFILFLQWYFKVSFFVFVLLSMCSLCLIVPCCPLYHLWDWCWHRGSSFEIGCHKWN